MRYRVRPPRVRVRSLIPLASAVVLLFASVAGQALIGPTHWAQPGPTEKPSSVGGSLRGAYAAAQLAAARASLPGSTQTSPVAPGPHWTDLTNVTPPNREFGAMVYDARDREYVLFGGATTPPSGYTGVINATWLFPSNRVWVPLASPHQPSARYATNMVYDAVDRYVLLWGGYNATGTLFNDTWKFAGGAWTQLNPTTAPPPIYATSMTYDASAGDVLLFGGATLTGPPTWTYKNGIWTKLTPAHSPPWRYLASLAYDAADGYPLLFGGVGGGTTVLADTWNFSGGDWHKLSPAVSPLARWAAGMAYDPVDGKIVLMGGMPNSTFGSPVRPFADTWLFGGGVWSKRATYVHPSARAYEMAADGAGSSGILLFGGFTLAGRTADTWSYARGSWTHVLPAAPPGRVHAMMAWDDADQYVLLYGGYNLTSGIVYGDTWKFVGGAWTLLHPKTAPGPRWGGMMSYDPVDGYILMFGGLDSTTVFTPLCGTWSYTAGNWVLLLAGCAGGPPSRAESSLVYDAADGYMLMFGGFNFSLNSLYNDTWEFANGAWSWVTAVGNPPLIAAQAMVYDSTDAVVLMSGGDVQAGSTLASTRAVNATWTYSAGTWTNISASVGRAPPAAGDAGIVDDTLDGYVVQFGGVNPKTVLASAFNFSYGSWTNLSSGLRPPALYRMAMAYDPVDGYAVLFGGETSKGAGYGATWTYSGS